MRNAGTGARRARAASSEIVCTTLETGRNYRRQLGVFQNFFVVLREVYRGLRLHLHNLVAAGLQFAQQGRQSLSGVFVEIVHQDDAFLSSFFMVTSITCCGLRALKSKESRIAREHRDVSGAEISHRLGGCCSAGKRKNGEGEVPTPTSPR